MAYVEFLAILTSIFGTLMSVAHFAQAYRIYKRKSSKDVSLTMYSIFVVGTIIWVLYGIATRDWPVIISFGVGIVGCLAAFILTIYYRKK